MGRQLLAEIRPLGYMGSLTHLQRLLNSWRRACFAAVLAAPAVECAVTSASTQTLPVPPIVASTLCIKPRGLLTAAQLERADTLKAMRTLATRFRGLLGGGEIELLDIWPTDAANPGIHAMRQFAVILRRDIAAVCNAISEPWSNGRTQPAEDSQARNVWTRWHQAAPSQNAPAPRLLRSHT